MKAMGLIKDINELENRVALTPQTILNLTQKNGFTCLVEHNAGLKSGFSNEAYQEAGAKIVSNTQELIQNSDIIIGINPQFTANYDIDFSKKIIIGLLNPYEAEKQIKIFYEKKATLLALELIPRISRAQAMDVLSSQANIAGYAAVIMAANKLNKMLPMVMSAAGNIKPAKVLILGAGVAGLSAISTAKRLGAVVYAYDVRNSVKEQIESLGGKFLDIGLDSQKDSSDGYAKSLEQDAQAYARELLSKKAQDMDIIITTAQIPGKKAPLLLDASLCSFMKNNSVIIDMAAKTGGNIANSVLNEWKKIDTTWVFGADALANNLPYDASFTFSNNIKALLEILFDSDGKINMSDEIISQTILSLEKIWK